MKQIFDWLREQVMTDANLDTECPEFPCWVRTNKNCNECNLKSLQVREIFDIINEAEAKWGCHAICYLDSPCEYQNEDIRVDKADCCEWAPMKFLEFSLSDCVTSCGHAEHYTTGIDKYCRHCGKPIEIAEVE